VDSNAQKHIALHLWTKGVFVEAHFRRAAGNVVDGENVEAQGNVFYVAFSEESLGGACDDMLLRCRNAQFRQRRQILTDGSCADFHKRQRVTVVADEIDFAFGATAWRVIAGNKNVAQPSQIPVGKSFSADACPLFASAIVCINRIAPIAQTTTRFPADELVRECGEERQGELLSN